VVVEGKVRFTVLESFTTGRATGPLDEDLCREKKGVQKL
jgi:hypothetical protein